MALHVRAHVPDRDVDVAVEVPTGSVLAVLGPNGAGKSTLLSVVAGLIRTGSVELDGRRLDRLPPHRRGVALLAQDALLFPHLSAQANVAFGPRAAGRRDANAVAAQWLSRVDAAELAARKPAQLSGGQAQRVAVARALAADPQVLLLDEPLAALDVTAVPAIRRLLRTVLRENGGRTAILVTHDVVDVLSLADRVVVLDRGRVVESGPVRTVLTTPRSAFAAKLAGLNLLTGTAVAGGLDTGGHISGILAPDCEPGDPAAAVFSPAAVAVYPQRPEGSPRNVFRVRVTELESRGGVVRIHTEQEVVADVTAGAMAELDLVPGAEVFFAVKATEVAVYSCRG